MNIKAYGEHGGPLVRVVAYYEDGTEAEVRTDIVPSKKEAPKERLKAILCTHLQNLREFAAADDNEAWAIASDAADDIELALSGLNP